MGKTVIINGATYSDVSGISVPSSGGETATFLDTSDTNAAAYHILSGKTAYVNGSKITGTILSQSARTVYPTGSVQTGIPAGKYASGAVTVGKVVTANILADNIKNGVTITVGNDSDPSAVISVTGTYQGQGGYTCSFDSNWSSMYGSGRMGPVTITYSNGQTSSFPNNDMDGMTFNNVVSITFVETEYEYWMINYSVGGSSDTLWLNAGDTETYTLSGNTTFYDFSK